tara:strand:- start:8968 stop:10182 length:1215 start_codon:yes stop_codon:yes gene_type:complete
MAQDFNSMFGTVNPQDAEAAYLARQQVSPNTMAQLPLLNQVVAMGGNAGAGLGNTVGRMLGGQTSVEADQALMKNIFSKAAAQSQDPMERLKIAAAEFDNIDPAKAQALRGEAAKFEEQRAKTDKDRAAAAAVGLKETRTKNIAMALKSKFPDMPEEALMGLAGNDKLVADLFKPENANKQWDTVTTADGVFRVNRADPNERVRMGDAKGSAMDAFAGELAKARLDFTNAQTEKIRAESAARVEKLSGERNTAIRSLSSAEGNMDDLLTTAAEAEKLAPSGVLEAYAQAAFEELPFNDRETFKGLVASLSSEKAIQTLKELKEQSRTGATGFGALSEKELDLLLAKTRLLNPKSKGFKANLEFVVKGWRKLKTELSASRKDLLKMGQGGGATGAGTSADPIVLK